MKESCAKAFSRTCKRLVKKPEVLTAKRKQARMGTIGMIYKIRPSILR